MSSFRLSQQARTYYRNIRDRSTTGEFDSVWDEYYLSAMAGIKARKRVPTDDQPPQEQEFVTEIIEDYHDQRYELYSAMIVAEIEREGIPWTEEDEIRTLMLEILDSSSHTNLTNYGSQVLNCYAEQGFKLIENEIPEPPELDEFLISYLDEIDRL